MPALPLTREQLEDAARLKKIYVSKKHELGLTQESLAQACGWESQGSVSQYLNGKIPLNVEAASRFADNLQVSVSEFSPRIAREIDRIYGSSDREAAQNRNSRKANILEVHIEEAAEATTTHGSSAQQQPHKLWTLEEEAEQLAKKFASVNRAAFAREFRVPGGQAMIYQHISGRRPISMECAKAYAAGFNVSLEEISPRLAENTAAAAAFIASDPSTLARKPSDPSPSMVVLDEFHRTKAEPVTDAIEKVLQIAGLGLDVLGGRIGLTATLATALRAQAEAASKEGVSEWNINDPNPAKGEPFFSKASAKKTGG